MSLEHSPAKQRRGTINVGPVRYNIGQPQPLSVEQLKVLTIKEWAALCGFSFQTGKRLIAGGDGPAVCQLSAKRIGVRVIDHQRWSEARLRSA